MKGVMQMEELLLVFPNEDYADEIDAYRKEMLEKDSSMDGCGFLRKAANPLDWIEHSFRSANKATLPKGLVVATQFICVRKNDNKIVGMIQVRHYFNKFLKEYGGNIGYSVRPSERKKGYAKWMLKSVLPFCKEIGLKKVLITCLEDNEASRRTIISQGGVFERKTYLADEDETLERYWIKL